MREVRVHEFGGFEGIALDTWSGPFLARARCADPGGRRRLGTPKAAQAGSRRRCR
jgi:hypothetical protein